MALDREAFTKQEELLRENMNRSLIKRVVRTLVWNAVLNGSETWTTRNEDIMTLEAFVMWI